MNIINQIHSLIWGVPVLLIIIITGFYFTFSLKFIQVFKFGRAVKLLFKSDDNAQGDISPFGALCSSLAATIGTGSIVGVATALTDGGEGALFWMCFAAFFGMAVKYAESFLGVKYRSFTKKGEAIGGAFYYIEKGLGKAFTPLAVMFAGFGVLASLLGIGTMVQSNSITGSVYSLIGFENNPWINITIGAVIAVLAGLVIIGGIKRIASFSLIFIPAITVLYIIGCLLIIILFRNNITSSVISVLKSAFSFKATGGGLLGISMMYAMRMGISRGIFSNEAGLGSEPIAAAAAKTDSPVKQGLISMTGTFIDTLVVCVITGLVILVTKTDFMAGEGTQIVNTAFERGIYFFPAIGRYIVSFGLIFYAFTSIIGWSYYGERCFSYLFGDDTIKIYRYIYIFFVFLGSSLTVSAVWKIADIFNGLMIIPNIIAVFLLRKEIKRDTLKFFKDNRL